jgi:hypothetical protein
MTSSPILIVAREPILPSDPTRILSAHALSGLSDG